MGTKGSAPQLELDLPALAALATSRSACEVIVAGRRPGVTRLVARNGEIQKESVGFIPAEHLPREAIDGRIGTIDCGFGYRRRLLEYDPIPGLRMTVPEALREANRDDDNEWEL